MTRAAWIDAFVMEMARLRATPSPRTLNEIAETYYLSHSASAPAKVAKWRTDMYGVPTNQAD